MTGSRPGCRRVLRLVRRKSEGGRSRHPASASWRRGLECRKRARHRSAGAARDPLLWRDFSSVGEVNSRRSPRRSKTAALRRELASDAAANSRQSAGRRALAPEPKEGQSLLGSRTGWGGFCVTDRAKSPRASITPAPNDHAGPRPRRHRTTSPTPAQNDPRRLFRPHRRSRRSTPATTDASSRRGTDRSGPEREAWVTRVTRRAYGGR
jgi:hypothetical protein